MVLDDSKYKVLVEFCPHMLWVSGEDALCTYFNSKWLEFRGKTLEQELGNAWSEGLHPDDREIVFRRYLDTFNKLEPFEMTYRISRFDGEWRWIMDRGIPFYNNENKFLGYIGICTDVTESLEGEHWKMAAQKDGLTNINNKNYFEQLAKFEYERSQRYKTDICVVMIDINKFKHVNDKYGHPFGDEVLKTFAGFLKSNIRDFDILGRYGGDEFIILLPNTSYYETLKLMERIEERSKEIIYSYNGISFNISFCYGVSEKEDGDTLDSFILRSDRKMYEIKKQLK